MTMLLQQLRWMVRLRWLAGAGVIAGGLVEHYALNWYGNGLAIAGAGALILGYNLGFAALLRPRQTDLSLGRLRLLAWAQILVDLVCLTFLTLWTGAYASPLQIFFVFHMVFASLLLPRPTAFAVALAAIGLVQGSFALSSRQAPTVSGVASGLAWMVTLLATVYLASRLARNIRQQARRLRKQNRRIRAISAQLRLHQQAMVQQEKMVAMGQMAAGVAHEIANPLASMDGLLQLLERRPERMTPESIARLREQVGRINTIVRQLTAFAHPGAAMGAEAPWQTANLNDIVNRALEVARFDQRLKHLPIEKSLDARVPLMELQPAALEQVILNIVINAVDAMQGVGASPSPHPKLGIQTLVAGNELKLMISDTGGGIPADLKKRIFDPFFTTKPVGKGTGLGLSISYSIVRKHGGEICVDSIPQKGSTFTVSLPLAPQGREAPRALFATPEKSGTR
jgi:signal transduction histidine kinase